MKQEQMTQAAHAAALAHGLDPALVCAVCEQETGDRRPDSRTGQETWNPWAIRYEPAFLARYVEKLVRDGRIHDVTEEMARAISWGLMQVMGEVAREAGYAGHLARLCDPETGVEIGCRVLAGKLREAHGDIRRGLLLWNGGANAEYADQVLDRVPKYKSATDGANEAAPAEAHSAT